MIFILVPPYIRCPYPMVGQAINFLVDIYVECYVHGYPAPRISWLEIFKKNWIQIIFKIKFT